MERVDCRWTQPVTSTRHQSVTHVLSLTTPNPNPEPEAEAEPEPDPDPGHWPPRALSDPH